MGRIAPKGRVQDSDYNQSEVIEDLVASGKEAVPYLIGKLDDETEIKTRVIDYWPKVTVGDVALIVLTDFFTAADSKSATIKGAGWYEFLECGDRRTPAEQCLRDYVAAHGRRGVKEKWQRIWEENKESIYWDDADRCFKKSTPMGAETPDQLH